MLFWDPYLYISVNVTALCFRKEIKLLINELDEEKKMRLSLQVSVKTSQEPLDVKQCHS